MKTQPAAHAVGGNGLALKPPAARFKNAAADNGMDLAGFAALPGAGDVTQAQALPFSAGLNQKTIQRVVNMTMSAATVAATDAVDGFFIKESDAAAINAPLTAWLANPLCTANHTLMINRAIANAGGRKIKIASDANGIQAVVLYDFDDGSSRTFIYTVVSNPTRSAGAARAIIANLAQLTAMKGDAWTMRLTAIDEAAAGRFALMGFEREQDSCIVS